ncbi:Gfo/Idh/MocA family oxidoreductase [Candidatus Poribacteria bacterium]|nr:Gfo/Idh/MocA family oxidoreductase [Candidatus Poribacteria bacterium]
MFRCAFLGCGGRARGHAQAYSKITRGKMVAICDLNQERLKSFGDTFGIENRYTDIHEMLDKEKPHVLHIVTQPDLRVPLMTIAAEHQVPAAIVEKPIALDSADYKAIMRLGKKSITKFIVNHQLRFHPKFLELRSHVLEGRIGEIRFIEVSARLNMSGQGTHVTDLLFAVNNYAEPETVMGQASGTNGFNSSHPTADKAEAYITFKNGVHGLLVVGENAPSVGDYPQHFHKRVAVYGTHGFIHWQMEAWERKTKDGDYEKGSKSYRDEDLLGQQGLTEAAFDWLEDETKLHPTRLDISLMEFSVILGIFQSVVKRSPILYPFDPEDGILESLKKALS